MGKLDGKVAIVTGAGRGLGRGYALHLASLGARVAVTDIDLKSFAQFAGEARDMQGENTADEINARGGAALSFEFDVSDRGAVQDMVDRVKRAWGRVDVLVTNAGGGRGTLHETSASLIPPDLLELVTRMNFYGTVNCCAAVAPIMKEQRSGKIVTVGSYGGIVSLPSGEYAHYGAIKSAVAHYTRYLAQELGPFGINANCIAPGAIGTARVVELMKQHSDVEDRVEQMALRRIGTVEECARVVEFLATEMSDYVTGALIPIDGGWNRAG